MPDRRTEADATRADATRADTTRRAMIAGVGAAGASVLLAGCGDTANLKYRYMTDGQATTAPPAPPAGAAPGKAAPTKAAARGKAAQPADADRLASTGDIPVGGGKILSGGKVVVTQPAAGTFKAYDTTCTHAGCTVNKIAGGTINCPCHGAKFSIDDGSVAAGPAPSPLKEVSIKVEGDSIQLA